MINLQRSINYQRSQILSRGGSYPAKLNLVSDDDWLSYCAVSDADPSRLHIPVADVCKTSKSTPCSPSSSSNRKHITFSRPASPMEPIHTEEHCIVADGEISKSRPSISQSHHHLYSRPESPLEPNIAKGCLVFSNASKSYPSSPSSNRKHHPIYTRPPSPIEPIRTAGGAMTTVGKELFPPLGATKFPDHPLTPPVTPKKPISKEVTPKKTKKPISKEVASVCEKERLLLKEIEYHRWEMEDLLKRAEDAKSRKLFLAEAYYGQLADLHFQAIENAGAKGDVNNNFCRADR